MNINFIRDKSGKIVLLQPPNLALSGWIVTVLFQRVVPSSKIAWLGTAFLFTWAFMEMCSGVNYFRRVLGLIVMVMILIVQFR